MLGTEVGWEHPGKQGCLRVYSLRHPMGLALASWANPGLQRWQRSPCTFSLQTQRPVSGSQMEPGTVPSGSHSQAGNVQETALPRGARGGQGGPGKVLRGASRALTQTGFGMGEISPLVAKIVCFAALTVVAFGVVLAVVTDTPARPSAGAVQLRVEVARGRVTVAVAP